ncbi:hypothetical protein EXS54_01600 [Patescibacteria group bacterium]|nr:hypothetical protein [Patescibacteria group bacterium]
MTEQAGRRPFVRAAIFLIIAVVAIIASIQLVYLNRALPGVYVGDVSVAGKSKADIEQLVKEKADSMKTLNYTYQDQSFEIPAAEVGLVIDAKATAEAALKQGREGGLESVFTPSQLGFARDEINPVYTLNQSALKEKLTGLTSDIGDPAEDASIKRVGTSFEIKPEASGQAINVNQVVRDTLYQTEHFNHQVAMKVEADQPTIKAQTLTPAKAYAETIASQPLSISAGEKNFSVSPNRLASWVTFKQTDADAESPLVAGSTLIRRIDDALAIAPEEIASLGPVQPTLRADIDREEVGKYIPELSSAVDKPPVNARLSFENGQVVISGQPQDGTVIDRTATVEALIAAAKRPDHQVAVPIIAKKADIRQETLASLGIKTLIGSSTTHFAGSPVNRTYNIGVGASKFDGVVIKPGEEFSFDDTLGDVGPETGYRQELVIINNKTEPQYGGGLCQVSTTMFRAALASGLPITARTEHSYAVHYYAPLGMDATIYPPYPDMKFINNTPGNILVQTTQSGTNLTYEFYGTSDGRKSSTEILSQNATEANGGTASFRYVVDGGPDPINRVFFSTYKPQSAFPVSGEKSLN